VTDLVDQWARQALNDAGWAHWHAEQDGINPNNSDQDGSPHVEGAWMKRSG
jgi:hypothetical protein